LTTSTVGRMPVKPPPWLLSGFGATKLGGDEKGGCQKGAAGAAGSVGIEKVEEDAAEGDCTVAVSMSAFHKGTAVVKAMVGDAESGGNEARMRGTKNGDGGEALSLSET